MNYSYVSLAYDVDVEKLVKQLRADALSREETSKYVVDFTHGSNYEYERKEDTVAFRAAALIERLVRDFSI